MASDIAMRRYTYEDCRPTYNIFWYWNERTRLVRAQFIRDVKRETWYESFGFFGPEPTFGPGPTVVTTGGSAPLILVHKPSPPDGWENEDEILLFTFSERFRSEQARVWQEQRKKKRNFEMAVLPRATLQVPPTQFTRKVRNAYTEDTEARHMKRMYMMLKPDTIDQLSGARPDPNDTTKKVKDYADAMSDAGSDAGSGTAETVCDVKDLAGVQKDEGVAHGTIQCSKATSDFGRFNKATSTDMLAAILVLVAGYIWVVFD